jgi:hypothetical protein
MLPVLLGAGVLVALLAAGSLSSEDVALSEHFRLSEFLESGVAARLGLSNQPSAEHVRNLGYLARNTLEPWRQLVGPLRVTSGYRSKLVNEAVGGVAGSYHSEGQAADVAPLSVSADVAMRGLRRLVDSGEVKVDKAIIYHPSKGGHIHVSVVAGATPRRQFMYQPAGDAPLEVWNG